MFIRVHNVGIWSVWHSGGPVLQCLNTRGCGAPGRTTHKLAISNQCGNMEELPAEVDCSIIVIHCDSLSSVVVVSVTVALAVAFAVCCMLDTVNRKL